MDGLSENVAAHCPSNEQLTAHANAFVERLIGSVRREGLDHVIVTDESSLKRLLRSYIDYYHDSRTHLSLEKDEPVARLVMTGNGQIISLPQVCGLHHRYERAA